MTRSILDIFDVPLDFLTQVVVENPSLRGMVLGYIAEAKLKEVLMGHGRGSAFRKDDDHDRKKKGDLVVTYEGFEFKIEVKSLQTNTVEMSTGDNWIRKILKQKGPGQPNPNYLPIWETCSYDANYRGQLQCDASDRRKITFPNNSTVETTNLLFGEFHILAAGLFAFREKWDFGFALNRTLPGCNSKRYKPYQRELLIASMIPVTWPLKPPFETDIYVLLDQLVAEEKAKLRGLGEAKETEILIEPPVKEVGVIEKDRVRVLEKKPRRKS